MSDLFPFIVIFVVAFFFAIIWIVSAVKSYRFNRLEHWEKYPDLTARTCCYLKREYLPEVGEQCLVYVCGDVASPLRWFPQTQRYLCPEDLLPAYNEEHTYLYVGEVLAMEHEGESYRYRVKDTFSLEMEQYTFSNGESDGFTPREETIADPDADKRLFFQHLVLSNLIEPIDEKAMKTI